MGVLWWWSAIDNGWSAVSEAGVLSTVPLEYGTESDTTL